MEYVKVVYSTTRDINVDRVPAGKTNEVLRVDAGTHIFDLGDPLDYAPPSQKFTVQGTTVLSPMVITFIGVSAGPPPTGKAKVNKARPAATIAGKAKSKAKP